MEQYDVSFISKNRDMVEEGLVDARSWGLMAVCMHAPSCLTLRLIDCSPPGSSVYGISQARVLEWTAISSSRGSAPLRDRTRISCISCIGRTLYH